MLNGGQVQREDVDGDGGEDEDDAYPEFPIFVGALPVGDLLFVGLFRAGVVVVVVGVFTFGHLSGRPLGAACVWRLDGRALRGSEPYSRRAASN